MEDSEKNRYIEFLIQQKEDRDKTIADKDAFIKNLQESLDMLKSMHESDSKKIDEMLAKINDLTAQLKLKNKQTYAAKSQKGVSGKGRSKTPVKPDERDRDEERGGFSTSI
jgi:peptidoglycan hydrolase CwlO-like protein